MDMAMTEYLGKLAHEFECWGDELSRLPWWLHAAAAIAAFVLFLVIASVVVL